MEGATEYVTLPVPSQHYAAVVAYLGRLMDGEAGIPQPGGPVQKGTTPTGRIKAADQPIVIWTADDLRRLKRDLVHRPIVDALIDMLLAHSGQQVTISEFAAQTGYSHRQLASSLAGFTQLIGREYGRRNWPIRVSFPDENAGQAVYVIASDLMPTWRDAVAEGGVR